MIKEGLKLRIQNAPWSFGVQMLIMEEMANGKKAYVKEVIMETVEGSGFVPPTSIIEFDLGVAQKLMDDLWNCGLRPVEGKGSVSALKATENHLKDMRDIALKAVDMILLKETKAFTVEDVK